MGLPAMRPLLLAGGKSTRMGTPKHLLRMPDGTPLYQRQLQLLRNIFPEPQTIFISLAQESETDEFLGELLSQAATTADQSPGTEDGNTAPAPAPPMIQVLRDHHPQNVDAKSSPTGGQGPAAGLLAAYRYDAWAYWVVLACDYPLVPAEAFYHLSVKRDAVPVTCFRTAQGNCEPLLAIWAPPALSRLAERVGRGHPQPEETARELDGLMIDAPPGCEWWLTNVKTTEEWVKAMEEMKLGPGGTGEIAAPEGRA
ncbi:molybdenum cofactor biosynthesis protein C [Colletotrichum orchidophilum]|uniref:Molybdenum cofactor biosynthesis protein C n=1 Tax=Colletotrichum orchidophilum TaxID=1209926 RepID=A0A1G4BEV9_9PEZI|nr:molybdenum cofactor biosynthesis protein C [Colletotrichum orchidophilum]OHE99903.1 molybdenum cofactor biosynthesis protein C [Colletotrichum orchidophilum]